MEREDFYKQISIAECKPSVITMLSICRFLPTKNNRRMRAIDVEIRKILREIIGKREKDTKNRETNKDDLLGLLLESNTRQSNGNASLGLTTEDVIEECKLFYFAGMETTSVLLTWTLIVLSMHPEWQERAREEVLSHFGRTTPDYDSLSRLKTVSAKPVPGFISRFQNCRLLRGCIISIPLSN
jgi:cytochrome P450